MKKLILSLSLGLSAVAAQAEKLVCGNGISGDDGVRKSVVLSGDRSTSSLTIENPLFTANISANVYPGGSREELYSLIFEVKGKSNGAQALYSKIITVVDRPQEFFIYGQSGDPLMLTCMIRR